MFSAAQPRRNAYGHPSPRPPAHWRCGRPGCRAWQRPLCLGRARAISEPFSAFYCFPVKRAEGSFRRVPGSMGTCRAVCPTSPGGNRTCATSAGGRYAPGPPWRPNTAFGGKIDEKITVHRRFGCPPGSMTCCHAVLPTASDRGRVAAASTRGQRVLGAPCGPRTGRKS